MIVAKIKIKEIKELDQRKQTIRLKKVKNKIKETSNKRNTKNTSLGRHGETVLHTWISEGYIFFVFIVHYS